VRYIEVNGINTWYSEQGTGEPLILLHGGMVASLLWDGCGIAEALAEHFRVFCVDRRAHGFTHDPGEPETTLLGLRRAPH
jgi:pimeloyl-ACP methyl ester carboxylesterase